MHQLKITQKAINQISIQDSILRIKSIGLVLAISNLTQITQQETKLNYLH